MVSKHAARRAAAYCHKAMACLVSADADLTAQTAAPDAVDAPLTDGMRPVTRPMPFGQVAYIVSSDETEHFELIQRDDLDAAQLTDEALHRSGVDRLTEHANSRLELLDRGDGIWELSVGGEVEASLLLIGALWAQVMPQYVGETPLAAIPHPDRLFVGAPDARARLEALATEAAGEGPTLYDGLLQRIDGQWSPA